VKSPSLNNGPSPQSPENTLFEIHISKTKENIRCPSKIVSPMSLCSASKAVYQISKSQVSASRLHNSSRRWRAHHTSTNNKRNRLRSVHRVHLVTSQHRRGSRNDSLCLQTKNGYIVSNKMRKNNFIPTAHEKKIVTSPLDVIKCAKYAMEYRMSMDEKLYRRRNNICFGNKAKEWWVDVRYSCRGFFEWTSLSEVLLRLFCKKCEEISNGKWGIGNNRIKKTPDIFRHLSLTYLCLVLIPLSQNQQKRQIHIENNWIRYWFAEISVENRHREGRQK